MSTDLQDLLFDTGLLEPVKSAAKGGHVEVLCRLTGEERDWLMMAEKLLLFSVEHKIDLHLCRRYVVRGGRMVHGWCFSLAAPSKAKLSEQVNTLATFFRPGRKPSAAAREAAPPSRGPGLAISTGPNGEKFIDMPLPHINKPMNMHPAGPNIGKGVSTIGVRR